MECDTDRDDVTKYDYLSITLRYLSKYFHFYLCYLILLFHYALEARFRFLAFTKYTLLINIV